MNRGCCAAVVLSFGLVLAMGAPARVSSADSVVKQVQTTDGVRYLSGGVGDDEETAIKKIGKEFDLRVTLATTSGEYLGGGNLEFRDPSGRKVLDAQAQGPLFFAQLPSGRYTVRATCAGAKSESRTLEVQEGRQTQVTFHLPVAGTQPETED
jgi:hypothetical protein